MAKKKARATERAAGEITDRAAPVSALSHEAREPALRVARFAVLFALIAAAFLVDPWAAAAFDAPKWLLVRLAAICAVCALLIAPAQPRFAAWSRNARFVVGLVLLTVVCAIVATVRSVHGALAWDYLLAMGLGGLWLVIGASRVLDGATGVRVFWCFMAAVGASAVLSISQVAGLPMPFEIASLGGRYESGAMLGNEGYVALAAALMGVGGFSVLIASGVSRRTRAIAAFTVLLAVTAIIVNRQITSALALVAAVAAVLCARFQQRALVALLAFVVVLSTLCAASPTLRAYTWGLPSGADAAFYQRVTTYRLGAWVAAQEMVGTRPWFGHGPGAFSQESSRRRIDAEIGLGARFVQPVGATFVYAHQEPLQLAAELGVVAASALLLAFALLFVALLKATQSTADPENLVLIGLLCAGAIASLAWFPLQIPITALALLLACGRAWRICAIQDPQPQ